LTTGAAEDRGGLLMAWRADEAPLAATLQHPRSSCRRQILPPPRAPRRVQIQTHPRYTLSASGLPLALRQTVGATRFSQIQEPDAPTPFEKFGLKHPSPRRQPAASSRHKSGWGAADIWLPTRQPSPRCTVLPARPSLSNPRRAADASSCSSRPLLLSITEQTSTLIPGPIFGVRFCLADTCHPVGERRGAHPARRTARQGGARDGMPYQYQDPG